MRTMWADALYDVLHIQYFESLWYLYRGDFLIPEAERTAAFRA